jgi:hypothetical protein
MKGMSLWLRDILGFVFFAAPHEQEGCLAQRPKASNLIDRFCSF